MENERVCREVKWSTRMEVNMRCEKRYIYIKRKRDIVPEKSKAK
jgi:hypothetical protein